MALEAIGKQAKTASRELGRLASDEKNALLLAIAGALGDAQDEVLAANAVDVAQARTAGLSDALLDRLRLDPPRLRSIIADVQKVVELPDPVGLEYDHRMLPNGLPVHRRRVPLGVVGVIYEARPNVTVDVATLCLKAGSAVILRGGKETRHSNAALVQVLRRAVASRGISPNVVQTIDDPDRGLVLELLKLDRYVDMIIPRGGGGLHQFCREHATVPVITGGIGVCHLFVDESADLTGAIPVIHNAKVQRPSVCNALDTVLVHRAVAAQLLPALAGDLHAAGVELRADEEALRTIRAGGTPVVPASDDDWGQEFLALVVAVKVVADLDAALEHIMQHSTGHTETILTRDQGHADRFVQEVDSAAIFVNASTRFNDGAQLGLGAEVAVSTQKLHARGPMALQELTTYKWIGGAVIPEGVGVRNWVRE